MTITLKNQEKPYSCAAACLSMVLDLPEKECRKLAHTDRDGTHMTDVVEAARKAGKTAHYIRRNCLLHEALEQLMTQSHSWPLILGCEFRQTAQGRKNLRTHRRQHAIVLWQGNAYDPGELTTLDAECLGHLGDRGITLTDYIIIEP